MARIPLGTDKKTGQEAWAEIEDADELTARQRRKVRETVQITHDENGVPKLGLSAGSLDAMRAALIATVITSWSYEKAVNSETVEDLPASKFDTLVDATQAHFELANFSSPRTTSEPSSSE